MAASAASRARRARGSRRRSASRPHGRAAATLHPSLPSRGGRSRPRPSARASRQRVSQTQNVIVRSWCFGRSEHVSSTRRPARPSSGSASTHIRKRISGTSSPTFRPTACTSSRISATEARRARRRDDALVAAARGTASAHGVRRCRCDLARASAARDRERRDVPPRVCRRRLRRRLPGHGARVLLRAPRVGEVARAARGPLGRGADPDAGPARAS